jgi:serine/threonine protein kinase/Tol biopolymer transport system component/tetratricopeptide (TPR) repeat protein
MKPTTDREQPPRVRSLFLEALDKTTGPERAAYLDQACGPDAQLRARVEALLKAHEQAGGFLRPPGQSLIPEAEIATPTECPGTVIGRYKLLEKIGEGGMAVVYMAEQAEPIRRKVALKIIKLGMDTRQVIARFEAERQALALMDHPSIAKVLDAGATETGRPYFVMELVTGVSITEYCDKNSLCTKDRLALFLQVCNAVQHAHQKGIIHRDLKPSNVMVTHHDGKPVPKVIDFGIAKATNQKLTEKTLFTRYAHIIGTPAYMSPEQAELSDLDIDTRSDIYSLGVLLYELLTGTTPFSEEELRKAGYLEMQRVIREQEPVKPSTRIRTALRRASVPLADKTSCGDARPTKTDGVRSTPYQLREVRGDLDWIVMKSLEKDRARRYETAAGLAEDVRRHLEHEPILARGPSTVYRLGKFFRRHRWQAIAALVTIVITGAAVVVLSLWSRDRLQLAEAEGLQHKAILSQAREQYAKADRDAALETIQPILASKHVGPEAQLLNAGILVENRRFKEAVTILNGLLDDRPEIAGAAHALLARILWESGSLNAKKLQEIEEHRQKAEALLPETAEAYFLRAMTALTVKEQLAALDKALRLDSNHYESRRLRAFTYYASRKYDRLQADALGMTILRPRDPLGYSLRAVAWRELGRYKDAVADYDSALALTAKDNPEYVDLSAQRSETLLRMGEHERVIVDAQECAKLWPDKPAFQYHIFCALTGLGDYDKATALFRQIVSPGYDARSHFQDWCMKCVFDTLDAGRSWHPLDREPVGAAFLPMVEAEENYRDLAAKGRRLTTDGFSAAWSPDGRKVAFSLGVQGRSGVALFDPATKETDLLIVPGKDPKWSPDGKYIAFVRDRQNLRLEELAIAEGETRQPPVTDEEVWLMNADGTNPRRLARGGSLSWSQDSRAVYYHSRADKTLCSISIEAQDARPKPVMKCETVLPSVSPDNRHVAYFEQGSLKIKGLASQALVAECPLSCLFWGVTAWSPNGNEVLLGGGNPARQRTGLWLYDLATSEFTKVLDGQITETCWSAGGTDLIFCLGLPYSEIWTAHLDRKVPASEALGPGGTLRDHYRQIARLYTRRIQADPLDADAYLRRAQQYHFLRQEVKARVDMRQYTAIVTQGKLSDMASVMPWDVDRVVNLPFDCQVVFSAERPVNEIPTMSVAFGQKGRGTMKSFKIPLFVTSLLGSCLLSGLDAPPTYADFIFGEPVNVETTIPFLDGSWDLIDCLSYDGLEMYIESSRPGGQGGTDIWVLKRATTEDDWGPPENLGPLVNSPDWDSVASISADGLTLYFTSSRAGGYGQGDIYVERRATTNDPWGPATNMGPTINSSGGDRSAWVSGDNLELYFASSRAGGYGGSDIYVARRATTDDPWGPPVNLGPVVNSAYGEYTNSLSPDGLVLFVGDWEAATKMRPGSYGGPDLWVTRRASLSDPWQPLVNLGPQVNGAGADYMPRISPDGHTLYFYSDRNGTSGIWQASILPNCDLNGDGKVDEKDLLIVTQHWGQNYPRADIAPFAWGDGIVDAQDWVVLMETMEGSSFVLSPKVHAVEVPRDAVLSWTAPKFAQAHDVYFGTSREDVSKADRSNPCSVLVSQAQTPTTYKPQGPLEYGRAYYWRVDFVGTGPNPAIYKGPVLDFKTEPYAYPITTKITATASSVQNNMGAEKTVDGSGLDKNDGHSTEPKDMWLSKDAPPQWIQYEFDRVYALHELWVWNSNQPAEPFLGFGAKSVKIEYSTDGTMWTVLANTPNFAKASGQPGYTANTTVSFGGVLAKHVKLTISSTWGGQAITGLSEVRFSYIPVQARAPQPADNATGVKVDASLDWLPGHTAGSHKVYFGSDRSAVANGTAAAKTVTAHPFDPGALTYGTMYYWRVDEVNTVTYPGDVWSFTTQEFAVVDDFESYTDVEDHRLYQVWIDGEANKTGSKVGYPQSPFAETTVVHGGKQSMPLAYDNTKTPFYSEATRIFTSAQNWTGNGADTLALWFRGNPLDFLQRADGSIQMSGGGADIWFASDQFRFAYKQLSGDGSIVAKVRSLANTSIWAKAGVMFRGSLDPASAYAFMFPTVGGKRAFQNRTIISGNAQSANSDFGAITLPLWVKIERKGRNFTGYYSQDGQNWIMQPETENTGSDRSPNPVGITMMGDVCIGLAVTSHNSGVLTVAEFSDVSLTGIVTGQWQVAAIGVEQPSNDAAPLYVTVEDSGGHVKALAHPDPVAVQTIEWQKWMIPLSSFQGVNLAGVKKMTIGVGERNSPKAGGTGTIYLDDIGFGHPVQ